MTSNPAPRDLVVLTADKHAQFSLQGMLPRSRALGIHPLTADYFVHPAKDPGVLRDAHNFLRPFVHSHAHALVLMDREGSGQEDLSRAQLEEQIETALRTAGWNDRAAAIVLDPELEIWVWSDSPHVDAELGWQGQAPGLRTWLEQEGWWPKGLAKPERPQEALEAALRQVRMPRSSAIYRSLAQKVSLSRCTDPAFLKLKDVLRAWFSKS